MTTFAQAVNREETDCRVFFRRPEDDSIYAVLAPATIERLRRAKKLDAFLKEQRESGIVIRPINK